MSSLYEPERKKQGFFLFKNENGKEFLGVDERDFNG